MTTKKRPTGTKEWATANLNIQLGCEHGCRYCFARHNAVTRFKTCTSDAWTKPVVNLKKVDAKHNKVNGRIMFPTQHDITPLNMWYCKSVLENVLRAGNQVLIVSKPHLIAINMLCEALKPWKSQIMWRFSIGTLNDDRRKFWEPNAPSIGERLACLWLAGPACYDYRTSVSAEPLFDNVPHEAGNLFNACVIQAGAKNIWFGMLNKPEQRIQWDKSNGFLKEQPEYIRLIRNQSAENYQSIYDYLKNLKDVRWKISVCELLGLEERTEADLD